MRAETREKDNRLTIVPNAKCNIENVLAFFSCCVLHQISTIVLGHLLWLHIHTADHGL